MIARKEDVLATWSDLTAEEAAIIARIKNSVYGSLTFYSPQLGRFVTRTVYTEDFSAEITSAAFDGGAFRTDTSLSVQLNTRIKLEIDGTFCGFYNAELPKRRNGIIELTAYDDMLKLDVEYPSTYDFP